MKLQSQEEKDAFLLECSQHIRRIQQNSGIKSDRPSTTALITDAKIYVLQTIFNAVNEKDVSENDIDLNSLYKDVKKQLNQGRLSQLPVPDVILKTLGSFDRTSNTDAVMKSHREVPLNNAFGYFLNLFRKEPLSTSFLKRTGFFNVDEKEPSVNSQALDEPKSTL
ncbi:hypothetical protein [Legionella maioricensis]|uniref:Uncharacterized protein n=1 Tax=Legionella maioricensis TaxID=2896528 RepID=A0A9X2CZ07_9GAMM|nr:hypothetical protein [Legionella maioricensis]MCL9683396.1 hypothetical protein [Legionella maioricensis]MCL9685908.1 hypothetical protein [Legionella maioricensis]